MDPAGVAGDVAPLVDVRLLPEPVRPLPLDGLAEDAGGECTFLGRTRRDVHPVHGALRRLTYEAYAALAQRTLLELAAEACRRFDCRAVRLHHALGDVDPGQASVLVQVACAHRGEAFAACRFLIDRLKVSAPIWKKEIWDDGTTWSEGHPVAAPGDGRG
jgi:molybdopterin synthase catalytic subunit